MIRSFNGGKRKSLLVSFAHLPHEVHRFTGKVRVVLAYTHPCSSNQVCTALGPSPRCFQSLLSLSDALGELGVSQQSHRHEPVIQASLRALIMSHISSQPDELEEQSLHDLSFLKAISSRYGSEWQQTTQAIDDKLVSQVRP